jgi:hypothetical protein
MDALGGVFMSTHYVTYRADCLAYIKDKNKHSQLRS